MISLGHILLSYIANTSHTRARTHTRTHARMHACTHARMHERTHTYPHTRTHRCARTHTRTYAHARAQQHTPPSPFMLSLFDGSLAANRDAINAPFRRVVGDQWSVAGSLKYTFARATRFPRVVWCASRIKELLGRNERRTRERESLQSI